MLFSLVSLAMAQDPLDTSVQVMASSANSLYGADVVDSLGPARLQPSTFRADLARVRSLLQAEGCTIDGTRYAGGAYEAGLDGVSGVSQALEPLTATIDPVSRSMVGTLGTSVVGGEVSGYRMPRFVVDRDGTSFYVGRFARVLGTNGVFMALEAECPFPASPETALARWIGVDLTGLDAPEVLTDLDGDGSPAGLDCDDQDPTVAPGALEICDGIRNDCDDPAWTLDSEPALTRWQGDVATNATAFPATFGSVETWQVCAEGLSLDVSSLGGSLATTFATPRTDRPTVAVTGVLQRSSGFVRVDGLRLEGPAVLAASGSMLFDLIDSTFVSTSVGTFPLSATSGVLQVDGSTLQGDQLIALSNRGALVASGTVIDGPVFANGGTVSVRGGEVRGVMSLRDANDGAVISAFDSTAFTGSAQLFLGGTTPTTYTLDQVTLARQLEVAGGAVVTVENSTVDGVATPFSVTSGGSLTVTDTDIVETVTPVAFLSLLEGPPLGSSLVLSSVGVTGSAYDVFEVLSATTSSLTPVAGALQATCTDGDC